MRVSSVGVQSLEGVIYEADASLGVDGWKGQSNLDNLVQVVLGSRYVRGAERLTDITGVPSENVAHIWKVANRLDDAHHLENFEREKSIDVVDEDNDGTAEFSKCVRDLALADFDVTRLVSSYRVD